MPQSHYSVEEKSGKTEMAVKGWKNIGTCPASDKQKQYCDLKINHSKGEWKQHQPKLRSVKQKEWTESYWFYWYNLKAVEGKHLNTIYGNTNKEILQRAVQKPHQVVCTINSSVLQLIKYIATYSCEIKIPFHLNYTGVRKVTQSYWPTISSSVCSKCLSHFFHRTTQLKTVQGAGWLGTNKIKTILCSFSKRNPDEIVFAKKLRLLRFLLHF